MNTEQIKACGFRVFTRNGGATYAYFTDGKRFGYIQQERSGGYCCSTVHIPNRITGTGYRLDGFSAITRENLLPALAFAPHWASGRDVGSIKKHATLASFLKEHSWGNGLTEV